MQLTQHFSWKAEYWWQASICSEIQLSIALCPCKHYLMLSQQETEEEEEQEEQEAPRRRSSFQESLSLPVPICYPSNGQTDDPPETRNGSRNKLELSSSPSLSPSQGDSAESIGSPSLSPPKDNTSPHSPSGFLRSAKKRESKGKSKELKGV